jgi:hypothetical protein
MEPQNREQRRHPEKLEQPATPHDEAPQHPPAEEMLSDARQQDDFSVRAKNTGHGKKTADKWNQ